MPQASDELREKWGGEMGVGEDKAYNYLVSKGYELTRQWLWKKPSNHSMTQDEFEAMKFLVDEWDYGGLAPGYTYD